MTLHRRDHMRSYYLNAYKQTAAFSYWVSLPGCSNFLYTSKILTGILLKKEKKKVVASFCTHTHSTGSGILWNSKGESGKHLWYLLQYLSLQQWEHSCCIPRVLGLCLFSACLLTSCNCQHSLPILGQWPQIHRSTHFAHISACALGWHNTMNTTLGPPN